MMVAKVKNVWRMVVPKAAMLQLLHSQPRLMVNLSGAALKIRLGMCCTYYTSVAQCGGPLTDADGPC